MYTRPQILGFNGLSVSDFPNQDAALKCADALIAESEKQLGHEHKEEVKGMPILNKYWYVHQTGLKKTINDSEETKLAHEADVTRSKK